jgi:hypothetical protein
MAFSFPSFFGRQVPPQANALGMSSVTTLPLDPSSSEDVGAFASLNAAQLVCTEDIYVPGQDVLLLKAGQVVQAGQIATLLKYGISPKQFRFEGDIPEGLALPPHVLKSAHLDDPATIDKALDTRAFLRNCHKTIMVVDHDDRSLRRTIDNLLSCGVPLHKIHPIRVEAHLNWALEKYQPDLLMLDFAINGSWVYKHDLVQRVGSLHKAVNQVVLMVRDQSRSEGAREALNYLTQDMGIRVIYKPLHRAQLKPLLV